MKVVLLLGVLLLIVLAGCTIPNKEDVATKIQAKYDSISSYEMNAQQVKESGSHEGYVMEGTPELPPLPKMLAGDIKVQRPDKLFIEWHDGTKYSCIGNLAAEETPKIKIGVESPGTKTIHQDNSVCKSQVEEYFSVFDTIVYFIDDGEITEEMLDNTPTYKVRIAKPITTKVKTQIIFTYWLEKDSLLLVQYQEEIPSEGYSRKIEEIQLTNINSILLPSTEKELKELIPNLDLFEVHTVAPPEPKDE